jgi:hypothetical protein
MTWSDKEVCKVKVAEWYQRNKEKIKSANKIRGKENHWYIDSCNPIKLKEKKKRYYRKYRSILISKRKNYVELNKKVISIYHHNYYIKNKKRYIESFRKSKFKLKIEVIEKLGGKCIKCGENYHEFLTIDHVNNNGSEHRKLIGSIYRMIRHSTDLSDYQLLCWNCNCSKNINDELCDSQNLSQKQKARWLERKYRLNLKLRAIEKLGSKCSCCGVKDTELLNVDHIHENGASHRKLLKGKSIGIYRLIRDSTDLSDYQLLCWNCNNSKHIGGICYHNRLANG